MQVVGLLMNIHLLFQLHLTCHSSDELRALSGRMVSKSDTWILIKEYHLQGRTEYALQKL
jgi:hypothetical protein